jgi:hypothetical protein
MNETVVDRGGSNGPSEREGLTVSHGLEFTTVHTIASLVAPIDEHSLRTVAFALPNWRRLAYS